MSQTQALRDALQQLHDAANNISTGEYDEEVLDIALSAARAVLSATHINSGCLEVSEILSIADAHADESMEDGRRILDRGGLIQMASDIERRILDHAALSATPAAQADWGAQQFKAPVYPPDGTESPFTVINLGSGKVQMGDSIHDGRLPALWFGVNGKGMSHEEIMNRKAHPGETLAVVTFANVEGLDVLLDVIQRIRRESFPQAQAAQAGKGEVAADGIGTFSKAARQALITLDGIADANPRDKADFETPADWIAWAKSRARWTADLLRKPLANELVGERILRQMMEEADTTPQPQPVPADGWLQDGGLLYRLTDGKRPENRDEINVTMADGSRSNESRARRAGELLDRIRSTAQPDIDYAKLFKAAFGNHGYAMGTRYCIAFKHGAEWFRSVLASPTPQAHDLWCIHIPGPNEVHAAPSKAGAEHMASRHNQAMVDYYASNQPNLEFAPSLESVQAVVMAWPHDSQSHADELREFDWAGWGITQPQAQSEGVSRG